MTADARQQLIQQIETAWGPASHPGDDRLAGQPCSCPCEYCYVTKFFTGRSWRQVTREALKADYPGPDYACLSFMSGEALRYYLGAFMILSLQHMGTDDAIVESAASAVTPPARMPPPGFNASGLKPEERALHDEFVERWNRDLPKITQWWLGRMNGLTAPQQQAVLAFLQYKLDAMRAARYPDMSLPTAAVAYWMKRVNGTLSAGIT